MAVVVVSYDMNSKACSLGAGARGDHDRQQRSGCRARYGQRGGCRQGDEPAGLGLHRRESSRWENSCRRNCKSGILLTL